MKIMYSYCLILCSFFLAAQEELTITQIADFQNNLMIEELSLSEEQKAKVKEINLKYAKNQKELLYKEASMFSKIGEVRSIKKAKNAELEKILSEEQFEYYEDELESEIRDFMRKHMKT